ncbi:thioredoxin-disulfide reductase [Leptotrichia sp. OH3620_COT-345]|uniref:thioredoxin-disulfide reductase n=1 Tax=Leptotrichia sp. OH3620_COT-345 TaxID=2491048 RepID=UPI000F64C9C3|nr:thioredoxin-disulfide reductase [Leptotrichia sp. OH3620_COT-345]RRD39636.1 thioredoxin-disulfide reductase [Leptotrichia sp. OH3620_COT-345]
MAEHFDLIIIGSGPAGLSSALYASRGRLKTLVLEKGQNGGQAAITHLIENYPGSIENPTGPNLTARMLEQCKSFGTEVRKEEVVEVDFSSKEKIVKCKDTVYTAKAVVIATGATPRKLDAPGIKELSGKGISYCATCDADFFKELEVYVVGGGNSAIEEAIFLSKFARQVHIVHMLDHFQCEGITLEKAKNTPNIDITTRTVVQEVKGDGILESIVFKNLDTEEVYEVEADEEDGTMGLFVFIGYTPQTELFKGKIELDQYGYIVAGENTETNVPGVFVAGDCRIKEVRQVVTAAADGAVSAIMAEKYISEHFE